MNRYTSGGVQLSTMQRNYQDRDDIKKFRHAYVLKASFNYSPLKPYCERIIFATDGLGDHVDNLKDQLEEALTNFDSDKDVLIPVGSALVNVMAGAILQKNLSEKAVPPKKVNFAMGIWSEGDYKFWNVYTDADMDAYEIIR